MLPARLRRALASPLLILGVYAALHAYVAQRLFWAPRWPGPAAPLLGSAALLWFGASVPLRFALRRRGAPTRARELLVAPAELWLGFGLLLLAGVALSDLGRSAAGVLALAWGRRLATEGAAGLQLARLQALGAGGFALAAGILALLQARRGPRVERVVVQLVGWPDGLDRFRIVQLSDVHLGERLGRSFAEQLVAQVNALGADLVAITGDLVDGPPEAIGAEVAPLAGLKARHGVYFVTGNHDHYSGADPWSAHLTRLGIRVLRNEHVVLEQRGARFVLAGIDDHHGGWGGSSSDLPGALHSADPRLPVVLLAHHPNSFLEAAAQRVALQLSGHTHAGQIWPFRYLVRLTTPFVAGLYREGASQLYVSRGTGFWGPPMRLGAPAEITELLLRSP